MLKNISPLLTPELLFGLAKLGHGDDVALVDANFPADRVAQQAGAMLVRMEVVGDAQAVPLPVAEFRQMLKASGEAEPGTLERFAFYTHASATRLVVQTGDLRKYANLLLRKGVISNDGAAP